eukprot:c21523_g1_i1 orf=41-2824(+)
MHSHVDSDLALALALADSNDSLSGDEDFQDPGRFPAYNQCRILRDCNNGEPKRGSRLRRKSEKADDAPGLGNGKVRKGKSGERAAAVGKVGKENCCESGNGMKRIRSAEGSVKGAWKEQKVKTDRDASFPATELKLVRRERPLIVSSQSFLRASALSVDEQWRRISSVVSETEEVVSLDEENVEQLQVKRCSQLGALVETCDKVLITEREEKPGEIRLQEQECEPPTELLSSTDCNFGTQLNALLKLCAGSAIEQCNSSEAKLTSEMSRGTQATQSSLDGEADGGGCRQIEDEDVMSVMTQVKTSSSFIEKERDNFDEESRLFVQTTDQNSPTLLIPSVQSASKDISPRDGDPLQKLCGKMESTCTPLSYGTVAKSPASPIQEDSHLICNMDGEHAEFSSMFECPVCGTHITGLSHEQREFHTNECLDTLQAESKGESGKGGPVQLSASVDISPVAKWLEKLGLCRYSSIFAQEEVDWETLKWLTEEDLTALGITALGPRRKIVHALQELKRAPVDSVFPDLSLKSSKEYNDNDNDSSGSGKKLITDFFPLPPNISRRQGTDVVMDASSKLNKSSNRIGGQRKVASQISGIPQHMCIPGTKFLVDAFQHLKGDCSHWFLTHFHSDHYRGLTRGFRHGHIYCSLITARLVNARIGVSWDCLKPLPLNKRVSIDETHVTFIDANHCPGSVMILFEPCNDQVVLHTGDFRFCEEMSNNPVLQACNVHTLVLDTTYCNPLYDFPKQETVIQFIIDAVQAEAFNPRTLFLIGTYTIGKERIFLELAQVLKRKVYVGAAKLHLLECMDFTEDDMKWLTTNDEESHIHVVPMWTIASFKRMQFISRHYHGRYNSIVAFSATGWSYGRGKKRIPGRRWQQGTVIRYEVPYSEHCSFRELQDFVKFLSPVNIIPSVHGDNPEAMDKLVALLLNEDD